MVDGLRTALAVIRRPDLWGTFVLLLVRMLPNGWWRGHLVPSRDYLDYRGRAVYGMPLAKVPAAEFIRYLEWCRAFPAPVR